MLYRYIARGKGYVNGQMREASMYHLVSDDGNSSVCGMVKVGVDCFELIETARRKLDSMTCHGCRYGFTRR